MASYSTIEGVRHIHHDGFSHADIRSCLVAQDCWDDTMVRSDCSWDDSGVFPVYDGAKWVCNWGDNGTPSKDNYDCSDGCTTSGIHRACQEPQRPQYLFGEWRCAWPGWQEESPGP